MDNGASAWIGQGARVNQNTAYALPTDSFVAGSFLDPAGLARKLAGHADAVSQYLWSKMTAAEQAALSAAGATDEELAAALASALDRIIALPDTGPSVALIVLMPWPTGLASPFEPAALLIVATVALEEDHVTTAVRFCVELSE